MRKCEYPSFKGDSVEFNLSISNSVLHQPTANALIYIHGTSALAQSNPEQLQNEDVHVPCTDLKQFNANKRLT